MVSLSIDSVRQLYSGDAADFVEDKILPNAEKTMAVLTDQEQAAARLLLSCLLYTSRYYIDEMHLLLKEEQTAAYTVEIWKRFRKWGGIPTGDWVCNLLAA